MDGMSGKLLSASTPLLSPVKKSDSMGNIDPNVLDSVNRQLPLNLHSPQSFESSSVSSMRKRHNFEWERYPNWLTALDRYSSDGRGRRYRQHQHLLSSPFSGSSFLDDGSGRRHRHEEGATNNRLVSAAALSTMSLDASDLEAARIRRENYWRYH